MIGGEPLPERTNFRHTVPTATPTGLVYRWAMSSVDRRSRLQQAVTTFWLAIAYEEMRCSIPQEQLRHVAFESIQALEAHARLLRYRYGFPASEAPTVPYAPLAPYAAFQPPHVAQLMPGSQPVEPHKAIVVEEVTSEEGISDEDLEFDAAQFGDLLFPHELEDLSSDSGAA